MQVSIFKYKILKEKKCVLSLKTVVNKRVCGFFKTSKLTFILFFCHLAPILGFRCFSYLAVHTSDIYLIYFILKQKIAK